MLRSRLVAAPLLVCAVAGCSTAPAADPVSSGSPSPAAESPAAGLSPSSAAAPATSSDPLSGERQVAIRMHAGPGAMLTVADDGRLIGIQGITERGIFVLVPVGERHQIRTASTDRSGEPACMGTKAIDGPDMIVAAACDAGADGQLFRLRKQDDGTYEVSTDDGVVQFDEKWGIHAQPPGDSPLDTTFSFEDQGPARPHRD